MPQPETRVMQALSVPSRKQPKPLQLLKTQRNNTCRCSNFTMQINLQTQSKFQTWVKDISAIHPLNFMLLAACILVGITQLDFRMQILHEIKCNIISF